MKYYFKENFRFFYADGALYDQHDDIVYEYQNTTLLLPRIELRRYGQLVGHVDREFTLMFGRYNIFIGDQHFDTLQQHFAFFKQDLSLERSGWRVEGDWMALNYKIYDEHDNLMCTVDQELFRLTRRYYVEIYDESRELQLILLVLAINQYDKECSAAHTSTHHSNNHR